MTTIPKPVQANLICGGALCNHDFDFARMRLAEVMYEAGKIRTDAANNYDDSNRIEAADMLVSYTSQIPVSDEGCATLRRFIEGGGRWFALHASNSVRDNVLLPEILGSRLITHPTYRGFDVAITKSADPLVEGIAPFAVDDEIFCIEESPDIEVLLHTRWGGEALNGVQVEEDIRPLMYRHRVGNGGVLYLALGHANRPFDKARPDLPDQPDRRGPWEVPAYKELIRRGIEWAAGRMAL